MNVAKHAIISVVQSKRTHSCTAKRNKANKIFNYSHSGRMNAHACKCLLAVGPVAAESTKWSPIKSDLIMLFVTCLTNSHKRFVFGRARARVSLCVCVRARARPRACVREFSLRAAASI